MIFKLSVKLLHLTAGIFWQTLHEKMCSSCIRLEGCFLQRACFGCFLRFSIGFRLGLIQGHTPQLSNILQSHSWAFLAMILLQDPWYVTENNLSKTWQHISLYNTLTATIHKLKKLWVRWSKATQEHKRASFHVSKSGQCSFLGMLNFCICDHKPDVPCQKLFLWQLCFYFINKPVPTILFTRIFGACSWMREEWHSLAYLIERRVFEQSPNVDFSSGFIQNQQWLQRHLPHVHNGFNGGKKSFSWRKNFLNAVEISLRQKKTTFATTKALASLWPFAIPYKPRQLNSIRYVCKHLQACATQWDTGFPVSASVCAVDVVKDVRRNVKRFNLLVVLLYHTNGGSRVFKITVLVFPHVSLRGLK